jgi:archaellum component FlaC
MGLVNLTAKQDLGGIEKTLEELRTLYSAHSSNEEIAVRYAKGLHNLTTEQDLEGREKTLEELRALYSSHSSNEEIAVWYAKGLHNLTTEQDLEGIEKTIEKLRTLYTAHASNEEIVAAYAASYLLEHEDCGLDELHAWIRNKQSVAEHFVSNILSVSLDCKKVSTARHCVDLAKELLGIYPDSERILLYLAKLQFNVSLHEEERERAQTISALQSYLRNHPRIQSDFNEALNRYLRDHPEHTERYRCLYV